MIRETRIEKVGSDGLLVEVGPRDPFGDFALTVPSHFSRLIMDLETRREVAIELSFKGDKLEISKLCIEDRGKSISSRDLLTLSLPRLIRIAALDAIPNSRYWQFGLGETPNIGERLRENPILLAKLYWFEHMTWGSPRVVIQDLLGCKRTTANYYIRLASNAHELPASRHKDGDRATAPEANL